MSIYVNTINDSEVTDESWVDWEFGTQFLTLLDDKGDKQAQFPREHVISVVRYGPGPEVDRPTFNEVQNAREEIAKVYRLPKKFVDTWDVAFEGGF